MKYRSYLCNFPLKWGTLCYGKFIKNLFLLESLFRLSFAGVVSMRQPVIHCHKGDTCGLEWVQASCLSHLWFFKKYEISFSWRVENPNAHLKSMFVCYEVRFIKITSACICTAVDRWIRWMKKMLSEGSKSKRGTRTSREKQVLFILQFYVSKPFWFQKPLILNHLESLWPLGHVWFLSVWLQSLWTTRSFYLQMPGP